MSQTVGDPHQTFGTFRPTKQPHYHQPGRQLPIMMNAIIDQVHPPNPNVVDLTLVN